MNTMTLLAVISIVGAAALFIALAVFLLLIVKVLEDLGGTEAKYYGTRASLLSKIRMGLRAIEVQTGALAPAVTQLNGGLSAIRDGLGAIDTNLGGLITAVSRQEAR
ncbi:MAG: hypothetical protein ACR2GG_00500 [Gemmatimonadaceae bacterium]